MESSIEWLEYQLSEGTMPIKELFDQAKAMEKEQKIAFGKKCFYKGFEKAENDDANCFTAWREEAPELFNL